MIELNVLKAKNPLGEDHLMQAKGYALWLAWNGNLNSVLSKSLEDCGGVQVLDDKGQALWFFFSSDVFSALARLYAWSKFNPMFVTLALFPGSLIYSSRNELLVDVEDEFWSMGVAPPLNFSIWVHKSIYANALAIPGLSLQKQDKPAGLPGNWQCLQADPRLPYEPSLGWYAIIHPLGNQLDKAFQSGWRAFFAAVEPILQRNKFRYTLHETFLQFPLDTLRQFKMFCRDFLSLVQKKSDDQEAYWPCSVVIVDRKGLNFNNDLPQKIGLDWEQLMPDYPHMCMRNATLLGRDFSMHAVRFGMGDDTPDTWCNVTYSSGDSKLSGGSLPLLAPGKLMLGKLEHCFYCGQRSHPTHACPTRHLAARDPLVWNQIAAFDFTTMRNGVFAIDRTLTENLDKLPGLLEESTPAGIMCRAIFDLMSSAQYRSINYMWRIRTKEFPRAASELAPEDDSMAWGALKRLPNADMPALYKELLAYAQRHNRDFKVFSLLGFAALELGEYQKAMDYWKEAEVLSPSGMIQSWHQFLQARLLEVQSNYNLAGMQYSQLASQHSKWLELQYRALVCRIKSGFAEKEMPTLLRLVYKDPHMFNKALLDPELERGQMQILSGLYGPWQSAAGKAEAAAEDLRTLEDELDTWFTAEHVFYRKAKETISRLLSMVGVSNFVAFQALITGSAQLQKELLVCVTNDGKMFKARLQSYADRLKAIKDEAAWFPFPKIMQDFNKNFNICAGNLNWGLNVNLHLSENFKKAQVILDAEKSRLDKMESKLKFLCMVRDGTLFTLVIAKSFLWMEIVGIILVIAVVPLALYYGESSQAGWAAGLIAKDGWRTQKIAILFISFLALAISALTTLLRFDKIRAKVFAQARVKEEMLAKERRQQQEKNKARPAGKTASGARGPSRQGQPGRQVKK